MATEFCTSCVVFSYRHTFEIVTVFKREKKTAWRGKETIKANESSVEELGVSVLYCKFIV